MRGDWVEIVVDVGDGVQQFEVVATKAGRRVEVSVARGTVEVSEMTRTGQVIRSARFMANRVVALVEHPAKDDKTGDAVSGPRRKPPADQPHLEL